MQLSQLTKKEILMVIKMRDEASAPMDDFGDSAEDAADDMRGLEDTIKQVSSAIKEFAIGFASAFSAKELLTRSIGAFRDYETGMTGIAKTTNMAGKELESFASSFDQMAMDMSVPISDMLAIAQAAGQLGVRGSEDILKFTETISKLQTATDLSAEDAAMSLAQISNVTGEGMAGIENYANVVVALGNNVAATEGKITAVALELAKATSAFDLGSTEVAAYAAAYAQIGTQADIAASSTARVIRELDNAANMGGQVLQQVAQVAGTTEQEFYKLIKENPAEAMAAWMEGMNPILNDTAKLNQYLKNLNLQGEEINKTIVPLIKNINILNDTRNIARTESGQLTAMDKEYQQFASTLDSLVVRMQNSMETLWKNIGVGLEPVIRPALENLADLIEWLADTFDQLPRPMQTVMSTALVMTPAIIAASSTFKVLGALIPGLSLSLKGLGAAFSTMLGPIGLVITALGLLTAAYLSADQTSANIRDLDDASDGAAKALDAYAAAAKKVKEEQDTMGGAVSEATVKILEQSRAAAQMSLDKLKDELRVLNNDIKGVGLFDSSESDWFSYQFKRQIQSAQLAGREVSEVFSGIQEDMAAFQNGEITLGSLADRLTQIAGAGEEAMTASRNFMRELGSGSASKEAQNRLTGLARQIGGFDKQLSDIANARTPQEAEAAYVRLATAMEDTATAGDLLRNTDSGAQLLESAQSAKEAERQVDELNEGLNMTVEQVAALKDERPLDGVRDSANDAQTAVQSLRQSMEDLPKEMQVNLKGMENSTDAVEAAKEILRSKEGYIDTAKWDMNAFRAGYGSDTITQLGTNGQPVIVKIQEGTTVNRMDAERDLERRIRDEFMPAAAKALGEVWNTLTPAQQGYMTSLTYNYGAAAWDNPSKLGPVKVASTLGRDAMADAIARLGDHNNGINRGRRLEEAAAIRNDVGAGGASKAYDASAKEQEQAQKKLADEVKETEKKQREFLDSIKDTSMGLELETQLIGKNTAQQAYLTEKYRLTNEAKKQGLDLDRYRADIGMTTAQSIEEEAQKVARLTAQNEALAKQQERVKTNGRGLYTEIGAGLDAFVDGLDNSVELASGIVDSLTSASGTFLSEMLDENKSFFDALKSTAAKVLADIGRMLIEHAMKVLIFKQILGLGTGGGDALTTALASAGAPVASANGNVFSAQGIDFFSKGGDFTNGVYSKPTMFKFGMNKLGVMGEAGPEAVMPLEKAKNGGHGVVFETVDPFTKKKVRRVIPLGRDNSGKLVASDVQMFARGAAFGGSDLSGVLNVSDTGKREGPAIGNLSVSTALNVEDNGGRGGQSKMDDKTASMVQKAIQNEVQSTVARVVTDMRRPGGLLYKGV